MARKRTNGRQRQGPPLQFRPGPELGRLIDAFASEHALQPNEACKVLVSLAVNELDCRYYQLLRRLAEVMGGGGAFPQACSYVRASLEGARRFSGQPLQLDPDRAAFIVRTVREEVERKGHQVAEVSLWFLPEAPQVPAEPIGPGQQPKAEPRRRVDGNVAKKIAAKQAGAGEDEEEGTTSPRANERRRTEA